MVYTGYLAESRSISDLETMAKPCVDMGGSWVEIVVIARLHQAVPLGARWWCWWRITTSNLLGCYWGLERWHNKRNFWDLNQLVYYCRVCYYYYYHYSKSLFMIILIVLIVVVILFLYVFILLPSFAMWVKQCHKPSPISPSS